MVEWSHQIQDVVKKSSAQPLLQGKTPSPLVEIDFWEARRADLESIRDQLSDEKVSLCCQSSYGSNAVQVLHSGDNNYVIFGWLFR